MSLADLCVKRPVFATIRTISRFKGQDAMSILVRKQSGINTVKVVDMVKERLGQIAAALPPDYRVQTVRDQSRLIRRTATRG